MVIGRLQLICLGLSLACRGAAAPGRPNPLTQQTTPGNDKTLSGKFVIADVMNYFSSDKFGFHPNRITPHVWTE